MRMQPWSLGHGEKEEQVGFDSICGIAHRYGCQHFFNFDGSDIFVCLYYVIVIFIAGACVLTENANIRQLRKKQVLQYDVVLVQKQPVIETESYGAENIRDTKRFTQYWEGMYIRDMRVRVSFQKKTIRKEKLVTR